MHPSQLLAQNQPSKDLISQETMRNIWIAPLAFRHKRTHPASRRQRPVTAKYYQRCVRRPQIFAIAELKIKTNGCRL